MSNSALDKELDSRNIDHLTDDEKRKRLAKLRSILQSGGQLGPTIGSTTRTGAGPSASGSYIKKTHGFSPEQEQYLKLMDWEEKNKKK